jgi:16S rRNA G966 N2-methylase RsmD
VFSELLTDRVLTYILENLEMNTSKLALAKRPDFESTLFQEILSQIKGRQALKVKASWYNKSGIIVPPLINIEQSSSELTAAKKFEQVSGEIAIDGTGGFGIDTFELARRFTKVIYVEPNSRLLQIVQHNANVLGIENITFINSIFEEAYPTLPKDSFLYLDPSRRNEQKERVYNTENYTPNIHNIELKSFSNWMIKLSPMVSITQVIEQVESVQSIQIIDLNNDCKEVNIIGNSIQTEDIVINTFHYNEQWYSWNGLYNAEETTPLKLSEVQNYVFEPWVSVLKAGLYKQLAFSTQTQKVAPNTNFFTSESDLPHFPGRRFKVLKALKFNKKEIAEATQGKAVVLNRNSKYATANEFVKQYNLIQAEPNYLLLFTDSKDKQQLLLAEKLA